MIASYVEEEILKRVKIGHTVKQKKWKFYNEIYFTSINEKE